MRQQHFGRSTVFHGKIWVVENCEFVEPLANISIQVSGSFDAKIEVANLVV